MSKTNTSTRNVHRGSDVSQDLSRRHELQVDSLFSEFARGLSPGAAVAVVRDGEVLLSKAYGFASLEHRAPITSTTVFDAASIAKQFTGLAVAILIDQGRIKLSDDIRKYIPELRYAGPPITIDHLVHHTSGLRDFPGTLRLAGWHGDDAMTFDQIITFASHQRTVNFVPGAEFSYSNTGFNLLAEMVARVTGKSFRAWTGEHFFRPLGMANSHFHDNSRELVPNRAYGYERTPNGIIARLNKLTAPGSSSLFTTVDDMARWVMNFDDAKVGGRRAMTLSRTTGVLNDGTKLSYAFGMFVGTYRGQVILNHTGEWEGFSSAMLHFPDQRFGVVILANSPIVPASSLTYWIADIFLEPVLGRRPPPVVESPSTVVDPFASAPDVALSPTIVERYVGLYRTGPGAYVRISRQNEGLKAQVGRDAEGPMLAKSDTSFWLPTNKAAMIFRVTADGGPIELRFRARRSLKVAESAPPTAGQLAQFAGKYESEELGSYLVVEVKEGALVLQDRRHGIIPLTWLWKDDFAGAVGYMRSVEFVRDSAGQVTGCAVFVDERTRNIRFTKRG